MFSEGLYVNYLFKIFKLLTRHHCTSEIDWFFSLSHYCLFAYTVVCVCVCVASVFPHTLCVTVLCGMCVFGKCVLFQVLCERFHSFCLQRFICACLCIFASLTTTFVLSFLKKGSLYSSLLWTFFRATILT